MHTPLIDALASTMSDSYGAEYRYSISGIPSWFRESRDPGVSAAGTDDACIHLPAAEFKRLTGAVSRE